MSSKRAQPSNRLQLTSWCLFDFANSSFTTVIITAIFAVYFSDVIAGSSSNLSGTTLWNLCLLVSNVAIILTAPIIGALADSQGRRKSYLFISYLICIVGTAALFWVGPGDVLVAMVVVSIANMAFATGENLIASFLPLLVRAERIGWLSSVGWATGYAGGLAALLICAAVMDKTNLGVPGTNLVVAAFFFIGGLPAFLFIKEIPIRKAASGAASTLTTVLARLRHTLRHPGEHADLARFLVAHTIFSMGVYGVIGFGGIYGRELFGMSQSTIIQVFMASQFSAAAGSLLSSYLCGRIGAMRSCAASLVIWIIVGCSATVANSEGQYWVIAMVAGFAMGLSLPSARAVVGELAPTDRTAEFFGYWGLTARLAAIGAPTGNLICSELTGTLRGGLWFFTAMFAIGLLILVQPLRAAPATRQ